MKTLMCIFMTVAVLVSCSPTSTDRAGGSSTTDNPRVLAKALLPDGTPAVQAVVRLRAQNYRAAPEILQKGHGLAMIDTITDNMGRIELSGLDTGSYNIEIAAESSAVLLPFTVFFGDTVDLGEASLQPFSTISGTVTTENNSNTPLYAQIEGLERITTVDTTGTFVFPDLPAATYTIHIIKDRDTTASTITGVQTVAGDSTRLSVLENMLYAKRLYLNTTSTGANVHNNVYNFPVLVRLDTSVIEQSFFSSDSGQDIRFTNHNNSLLPFEIEYWNRDSLEAVIWVKIDTVYGLDSTQSILLHWGAADNSHLHSASSSESVFDTSDGFAGVWHLGESPSDMSYHDATAHNNDGERMNNLAPAPAETILGRGQSMDGSDQKIRIPASSSLQARSAFTVSAWVRFNTLPSATNDHVILFYHYHTSYPWFSFQFYIDSLDEPIIQIYNAAGTRDFTAGSYTIPPTAEWIFFAARWTGDSLHFSVNGTDDIPGWNMAMTGPLFQAQGDFYIGGGGGAALNGIIDEVRYSHISRSRSWIQLSYMNQKAQDALIRYYK